MGQNRCEMCNHFAGLEQNDPEVQSYNYDRDSNTVEVDVRISLATACCNADAKDYTFQFQETPNGDGGLDLDAATLRRHKGKKKHDLRAENVEAENDVRVLPGRAARYTQTFYGVIVKGDIKCACGETLISFQMQDEVEASAMETCN